MFLYCVHFRPRLSQAHVGFQARDAEDVMSRTIIAEHWIALPDWCIDIRLLASKAKIGPQNANDCVADTVHGDGLADRRTVACKLVLPQTMADDNHRLAMIPVLRQREIVSESQLHSQRAEEVRRDVQSCNMFRSAGAGYVETLRRSKSRNLLERASIALPIEEVGI